MAGGDFSAKRGVKVKKSKSEKAVFLVDHAISTGSELIDSGRLDAV
jgi:hypothetical protein